MDFALDPDLVAFQRSIQEFVKREFGGRASSGATDAGWDANAWNRCADLGIPALPIAERYGGLGKDVLTCVVALEALGRGCPDSALLCALSCHIGACAVPIHMQGTDVQKNTYLPGMAAGYLIGGHPMVELGPAWTTAGTTVSARRTDEGFVLRGQVAQMCNASIAHVFTVFAVVEEPDDAPSAQRSDRRRVTAFVVDRKHPGVRVGAPLSTMGMGGALMAELSFEDCLLAESAVLGTVHQGYELLAARFRWQLLCLLAWMVGRMHNQLDVSVEYAKNRRQFGKPIGAFQAVGHKLADMHARLELARLILYKAAWLESSGGDAMAQTAIAKLFIGREYIASSRDALQIHGGYGFMSESNLGRDLSDAMGSNTYGGSADVQRDIIARLLGLGNEDAPLSI